MAAAGVGLGAGDRRAHAQRGDQRARAARTAGTGVCRHAQRPDPVNLYRSTNGAVGWTGANEGMRPNISMAGLAADPQNPNLILAGDGGFGYMYRSRDAGRTWEELPGFKALLSENAAVGELYSVVQDGVTVFFAATRYDGVFRSPNAGDIWQKLDGGLQGEAPRVRGRAARRHPLRGHACRPLPHDAREARPGSSCPACPIRSLCSA